MAARVLRAFVMLIAMTSMIGLPRIVRAEEPPVPARSRVIVLRPQVPSPASAQAARRIEAELGAAGFDVVAEQLTSDGSTPPAIGTDASGGSFAWVILVDDAEGAAADVWIRNPLTGARSSRRVDGRDVEASSSPGGLAIRSVELLRASLLDLGRDARVAGALPADVAKWAGVEKAAPAAVVPSGIDFAELDAVRFRPADRAGPEPPSESGPLRSWIGGGIGTIGSHAGLGLSMGPRLALRQELPEAFLLDASIAAFLPVLEIEPAPGGEVETQQVLLLVGAARTFGGETAIVLPHVGAALGAHVFAASGNAFPFSPYQLSSRTETSVGVAFGSGGGLCVRLGDSVRIVADVSWLVVLPEPVVVIAGVEAGRAGFPLFTGTVGAELAP